MDLTMSFEQSGLRKNIIDALDTHMLQDVEVTSRIPLTKGYFQNLHSDMDGNASRWLGIKVGEVTQDLKTSMFEAAKGMYAGNEINGKKTLGLKEIGEWNINPQYAEQNLKQHAGFAAEVISTTKENLIAEKEGTGITTYRVDDIADSLPDSFRKNDPYVDKVRINQANEIVERVQTKFVGKDGADCLKKLASKKYDKYFNDGRVDKIEISQENFDEIRKGNLIEKKIESLKNQIDRVTADGKNDVAQKRQLELERYQKIDQMIERSTVSQAEASYAVKHPKRATAKLFAKDVVSTANDAAIKGGLAAAGITATVSTVDNVSAFFEGEITAGEMAKGIAGDVTAAGVLGYGTEFVSTAVSQMMSKSTNSLIRNVSGSCLPAVAVSFAVDSFDSISDYAQGIIDTSEFVYDLGESASNIGGSLAGGTLATTAVATVAAAAALPVAAPVGVVAGIAGGVIGCAVASEAYVTAVKVGADGVALLAEKAESLAHNTIDLVETSLPDKVGEVKCAFSDFIKNNNLPFSI